MAASQKISDVMFCTFNCRSIKNSMFEVQQLCDTHDLILLQEHWLLPNELHLLSEVQTDFLAFGASAVDIGSDILVGRPYGGTAILFKKILADCISSVKTDDSRLTGIKINTRRGPILVLSVYMPTDYHDKDSLEKYVEVCGKINALITECDVVDCIIAGDFNCSVGSCLYNNFVELMSVNNLTCTDLNKISQAFTYCNSDHSCISWIDHILCTTSLDRDISDIRVLYDYISSDHKPLSVKIGRVIDSSDIHTGNLSPTRRCWKSVDDMTKLHYSNYVDMLLQNIVVPNELRFCLSSGSRCSDCSHYASMSNYYNQILSCVEAAVNTYIPLKNYDSTNFSVPGWNDLVQDKHHEARSAYLEWLQNGKARSGYLFQCMQKTRASFKLALRYCKQQEAQLRADAYASNLRHKDPAKFWQSVT